MKIDKHDCVNPPKTQGEADRRLVWLGCPRCKSVDVRVHIPSDQQTIMACACGWHGGYSQCWGYSDAS